MGSRGIKGGDEFDGLTKSRRWYHWQRGTLRKLKRKFWRRTRMESRRAVQREAMDETH